MPQPFARIRRLLKTDSGQSSVAVAFAVLLLLAVWCIWVFNSSTLLGINAS